jgi:hypothetical protein
MGEQTAPPEPGTLVLGRYRLRRRVGAGGMGVVWLAVDETLDMQVALKSISLAGLDPEQRRLALERTRREARTSAKLRNHTHVVATYDIVDDDDTIWLVLEYVPSQSLGELRRDSPGRLDVSDVARIGAQVCDALAAAHARGIVHRDVTPGNILISDDGVAKLTDFGISHANGYQQITEHGTLSGTIAYLAPEVAAGAESTPASDMWSLGATLYHTLEGQPPFGTDDNPLRLLRLVSTGTIRPPTQAGELTSTLQRLLAPDHTTRPDAATTRELLNQLVTRTNAPTQDLYDCRTGDNQTGSTRQLDSLPSVPPDPAARPGILARHRTAAIAVLVALVLLVGAGTAFALLTSGGDTKPRAATAPPVPPPIAITGNPKDADPCALIDFAALRQFGTPRRSLQGFAPGCQAAIDTPTHGGITLEVYFSAPANTPPPGERSRIGDLALTRASMAQGTFTPYCNRTLTLTDRNHIVIDAVGRTSAPLCEVSEAGLQTVLTRLRDKQITYTPGRTAARSFSNVDACTLLSDDDIRASGVEATIRTPEYGNWGCHWGTTTLGVKALFRLDDATPGGYGTPTVVGGRRAWFTNSAGASTRTCAVYVVSRPAATPQSETEILETTVTNTLPNDDRCKRATDLATKALTHLPMT